MGKCECCGNTYDKAIKIVRSRKTHLFDCFECAIHVLAPACAHCGCKIIGHGVEEKGTMYCCANCARGEGARHLKDRA